jgi:uncharacterized protein
MNPSLKEIEEMHRKYALNEELFSAVYGHCRIVEEIALQLISNIDFCINKDLVRIGCLLHDIGVYKLFDKNGKMIPEVSYITHGIRSEEILKNEGFSGEIWKFGSHHTGVGLSMSDIKAQGLQLPLQDYLAETPEQRLVMYADKFHSKTTPAVFNSFEWYKDHVAQFGNEKVATFEALASEFGMPKLKPLSQKYGLAIR